MRFSNALHHADMSLISASSINCSACLALTNSQPWFLHFSLRQDRRGLDRIIACKPYMPSNSQRNFPLQHLTSFAEHSTLHSAFFEHLAAISRLPCSMSEVFTVLQGSYPPPRPAHPQPIVSTLTSCVSLQYCILPSLLPVLLSDALFDGLSLHACFSLYRFYSVLTLRLLMPNCIHDTKTSCWLGYIAPIPLRYLHKSLS